MNFFAEVAGGLGGGVDDFFGSALGNDFSSIGTSTGAEVDDPIGGGDDVHVVLNDDEGISGIDEVVEDLKEHGDVRDMEAGGGLIEDEQAACAGARGEELAEFQTLRLAAADGVERLAEGKIAEADALERGEEFDVFVGLGFDAGRGFFADAVEEIDGGGDGHVEDVGDGFPGEEVLECGFAVASAVAVGAFDLDVAEKLHFHFFVTSTAAAVAATFARVEGEIAGGDVVGDAHHVANVLEDAAEDGGGGARGADDGGLIDHHDVAEVLEAGDGFDRGGGIFFVIGFATEFFREVEVDDLVGEGGFSRAGNAGEDNEAFERDVDVETAEVVTRCAAEGEDFFRERAAFFGEGDGFAAIEPGEGAGGSGECLF